MTSVQHVRRRVFFRFALGGAALLTDLAVDTPSSYAAIPKPSFGPRIDRYAPYEQQAKCDPVSKPGPVDFCKLLDRTYGPHWSGITRACDVGNESHHKEGRALDYGLDVSNATDRAVADDVLTWLLATDEHGNRHAMARRLGLMYIIWNRQEWVSWAPAKEWAPHTSPTPHTDHIHFSFSWKGALQQTTWWTAGGATGGT